MTDQHSYTLELKWRGKTDDPHTYDRSYIITGNGKTQIAGSADSFSRGDPNKWNPEEMLLGSLGSCYMLWYLYLCAASKIIVTEYQDQPTAILNIDSEGTGAFTGATLNPHVVITDSSRIDEARALESQAHKKCFIVNSINFEVKVNSQIKTQTL